MAWRLTAAIRGHLWHRQDHADGLACGRDALRAAQPAADPGGQAIGYLTLGMAYQARGEYEPAAGQYTQALVWAGRAGWTAGEIAAQSNLGLGYELSSRLDDAERHLSGTVERGTKAQLPALIVTALINLAYVSLLAGRLDTALDRFTHAVDQAHRYQRGNTALALGGLGLAHGMLGRFEPAMGYLTESLAHHRDTGSRYGEAMALTAIAQVHHLAGRYRQSRDTAAVALSVAEHGAEQAQAGGYCALGDADAALGRPVAARAAYQRVLAVSSPTMHGYHHCTALVGLARLSLDLGAAEPARQYAQRALVASEAAGYRLVAGDALTALAQVCLADGDAAQAALLARQAVDTHTRCGYRLGAARALVLLEQSTVDPVPAVGPGRVG